MPLESCIYECEISHSRKHPALHEFRHRHFMLFLSLSEIESIEKKLSLFSSKHISLYTFRQSDYIPQNGSSSQSLINRVKAEAAGHGFDREIQNIQLLTNVRVANYVFNPISIFFCFGKSAELLCCIVEVGNTFGEKKTYLVKVDNDGQMIDRQKKLFYVSPFTDLDQDFVFKIDLPAERLRILIDTVAEDKPLVQAGISGKRLELSDENLFKLTIRYPLAPLRVIALIHLHALILWLKRIPHHKKEENTSQQLAVLNPHKSLRSRTQGN